MHLTKNLYRALMPYCLKRLEDKPCQADNCPQRFEKSHVHQRWVVLNREYKPIGIGHSSHEISYEPFAIEFKTPLRDTTLANLSFKGEAPGEFIFFYDDGCAPWRGDQFAKDYFQRLDELMKLPAFVSPHSQVEQEQGSTPKERLIL
jgi:hypothetical protein